MIRFGFVSFCFGLATGCWIFVVDVVDIVFVVIVVVVIMAVGF